MASSHGQDRQAATASGQRSKSSKGRKRPAEAYDDQGDARWEGSDPLFGDTFSNLDLTSSHASSSSKLVTGQSHADDPVSPVLELEVIRDSIELVTHGPQGKDWSGNDDLRPSSSQGDNITDTVQLYVVLQQVSEDLITRSLGVRNSSDATPIEARPVLRCSRSFAELSTLREDRQTAGDTSTRSAVHTTGLTRSRSLPPRPSSQHSRGGDAAVGRNTGRNFDQRTIPGEHGRQAPESNEDHPEVQSFRSEVLQQVIDTMVALLRNPNTSSDACLTLLFAATAAPSLFSNEIISKITALIDNPSSIVCVSAMTVLRSLALHANIREFFGKDIISKAVGLQFDPTADVMVREEALSLLKEFAKYDDVSTSFSSTILSKASTLLEAAVSAGDTTSTVATSITSLSGYAATRAVYEEKVIPGMVALLGNTDIAIHEQAANILIELVNESIALSDDTILQMVRLLNNPSAIVSENTRLVLSTASCYDTIQNCLAKHDNMQILISFMKSDFIHAQCCVISIFGDLVKEKYIRAALLHNKLLPIVSDLLNNDTVNSYMLRLLLSSLGQFVQYKDLRCAILRTDTIYTLACLRSSKRLPEDYIAVLSELIADEHLALSFPSKSDDPSLSPFTSFHCLIGAQEAMERVLSEENALQELLNSHHITPHDYFVQAGFNEDLLDSGAGHLEEIYIYLTREVDVEGSGMLDGLALLFRPFPCVLSTPGNSFRTPTPSTLPLGFDSVILERANRHHQLLKLTNDSKEGGFSEPMDDGEESTSRGRDGDNSRQDDGSTGDGGDSGGNKGNGHKNNPPGSGDGDGGGAGKAPNGDDNDEPSDKQAQPGAIKGKRKENTAIASCFSHVDVYIPRFTVPSNTIQGPSRNPDTLFQQFNMHVELAVKVQPPSDQAIASISLEFNHLRFHTKPVVLEYPYEHSEIKVKVDSSDKCVYIRDWRPQNTAFAGPIVAHTDLQELSGGGTLTIGSKVSGTLNVAGKVSHTQETNRNRSRITAYAGNTFVEWVYDVDDSNQRQRGLQVEDEKLSFVEFGLRESAKVKEPLRVELSGHWVSRITPVKRGIKIFSAKRKRQAVPLLRNFSHLTCITLPPHLSGTARSEIHLEAHMPSSKAESAVLKSVDPYSELGVKIEGKVELES